MGCNVGCTVCGSGVTCTCNQSQIVCTSTPNPQCCAPAVPASPTPYYECASPCPENHNSRVVLQQFNADIKVQNTWNIPACGEEATITVIGLKSINLGSYIWNQTYGYFEVVGFDTGSGQVTIENHCNEGNAVAGTTVPACTLFTVVDPPCDCPSAENICVAVDFTAPDVGDCLDITLTTNEGIRAGDTVEIGTGFYFVNEVKPNNIINICNEGQGITPGTPVIALDSAGDYNYCLTILTGNPCDADAVLQGKNIVCNTSDQEAPLGAAAKGYVLTIIDNDLISAAYRPLGNPDCTTLTAELNILIGVTSYNGVVVANSAVLAQATVLRFGNSTYRATFSIVDATHIDIDLTTVPAANNTFSVGTLVCPIDCCEFIYNLVSNNGILESHGIEALTFTPNSLSGGTPGSTSSNATTTLSLTNDSYTNDMKAVLSGILTVGFSSLGANTDPFMIEIYPLISINGGTFDPYPPLGQQINQYEFFLKADGAFAFNTSLAFNYVLDPVIDPDLLIAPGETLTIAMKFVVSMFRRTAGTTSSVTGIGGKVFSTALQGFIL